MRVCVEEGRGGGEEEWEEGGGVRWCGREEGTTTFLLKFAFVITSNLHSLARRRLRLFVSSSHSSLFICEGVLVCVC